MRDVLFQDGLNAGSFARQARELDRSIERQEELSLDRVGQLAVLQFTSLHPDCIDHELPVIDTPGAV